MLFSRFHSPLRHRCRNRLQLETLETRLLLAVSVCTSGHYGPSATLLTPGQQPADFCQPSLRQHMGQDDGSLGSFGIELSQFDRASFDVDVVHWRGRRTPVVAGQWIVKLTSAQTAPMSASPDVTFVRSLALNGSSDLWLVQSPTEWLPFHVVRALGKKQVSSIEPNFAFTGDRIPNDPQFDLLWGLENSAQNGGVVGADVSAMAAWEVTTGAHDVVIAAFDSGLDYTHPDLAENTWRNPGEVPNNGIDDDGNGFVDDVLGIDVIFADSDPWDGDGHGTHTAGTMGAVGNNGIGVAGVAWDVQIMPIKILTDSGVGSNDAAILGMNYMLMMKRDFGINVVASNHSWSGASYSRIFDDLITEGIDLGITFVVSAGNDSQNNDAVPTYPASYPHDGIIVVAATDANDELAEFSRYGSQTIDLAAPGVDVLSTILGGTYGLSSGTSMSAPFVTGAVALFKSRYPGANPQQIKSAILSGVDPLTSLETKTVSGGRLNIAGAFDEAGFFVNASSPEILGRGSGADRRITEFELVLSHPMNAQNISATDFAVNGVTADNVEVLSGDTLRFEFLVSPLREQGLQVMSLEAGAVSRVADGLPNDPFAAQFRYDEKLLGLNGTFPFASVVELPWSTLEVFFNEPIDFSSLDSKDLWVSEGEVIDFEETSASSVQFSFTPFINEVPRLQMRLYKGSFNDVYGNPLPHHIDLEFELDHRRSDFPGDWIALEPKSSLAATRTVRGTIARPGDRDELRVFLKAGQLLSVAAEGANVSLRTASGAFLATFGTRTDRGEWGTHLAETTGDYTIIVSGNGPAIGDYVVQTLVNAVFEIGIHLEDDTPSINDYEVARGIGHQAVIVSETSLARTYEIDLADQETFSIYVQSEMTNGVEVRLVSESGQLLQQSNGRHAVTIEQNSGRGGRYQIHVVGDTDAYTLVTTRNATIDNGRNYLPSIAQDIVSDTTVFGFLPARESVLPTAKVPVAEVWFRETRQDDADQRRWPERAIRKKSERGSSNGIFDLSPGRYLIAIDAQIEFDQAISQLVAAGVAISQEFPLFQAASVLVDSQIRLTGEWLIRVESDVAVKGQARVSDDTRVAEQWALEHLNTDSEESRVDIGLRQAWEQQPDASSIVVAILDTGVDYRHVDLAANLWRNPGEIAGNGIDDDANGVIDDDIGFDFLSQSGRPNDDNGHGTHLAGIVGAVSGNEIGVAGIAPGVEIMPIKVLDENRNGRISDVLSGLQYLLRTSLIHQLDLGAVLLSWTTEAPSQFLEDAIEAVNSALGAVVVVPAGNDSVDRSQHPIYPASASSNGLISVAATDRDGRLADFSAYGESISLAAPGVDVLSTLPGDTYGYLSGTSASSAFVAGAAALLSAANPSLPASVIGEALLQGTHGDVHFRSLFGGTRLASGRLNIADSLQWLNSTGDYYRVAVSPGVPLSLVAVPDTDRLGVIENRLSIGLEVYSAEGERIATSEAGILPGSAEILFEPFENRDVWIHVFPLESAGAYNLFVDGIATHSEVRVAATTPRKGGLLPSWANGILVHFDDSIASTIHPEAFAIDDQTASFRQIDDDTVEVFLPLGLPAGTHTFVVWADRFDGARGGANTYFEIPFRTAAWRPDFDGDGQLGCGDLSLIQTQFRAPNQDMRFDLTGDGVVNNADSLEWVVNHLGTFPGDANLDGFVDGSDWNIWNDHKFTTSQGWCQGDFSGDGIVNATDWNLWHTRRFRGEMIFVGAAKLTARIPRSALSTRVGTSP